MELFKKEYIEKCIYCPEIQSEWNMEVGTYYYETRSKKVILIGYDYELIRTSTMYYLPRQDEVQILIKQKIDRFINMNDLKFDYNMRHCIFKLYCTKILNVITLNDMWLVFYMMQLHGKQWDTSRKEWIAP